MAALLADPDSLNLLVTLFVFCGVMALFIPSIFLSKGSRPRNKRHFAAGRNPRPKSFVPAAARSVSPRPLSHRTDPTEQLRAVMASSFTAKRVLSRTEAKVMHAAEAAIAEAGLPWRMMAQVALGEVLASPDEAGFFAINAKRVDLLVVSEKSEPLAAIEYQGQGHYQGTAPARDAIKKEALRKAGIRYIEITHEHGPDDVRREIKRMAWLGKPKVVELTD